MTAIFGLTAMQTAFASPVNSGGAAVAVDQDHPVQIAVTKVLQMPTGTAVPTGSFFFDFAPVSVDDATSGDDFDAMPPIGTDGTVEVDFSASDATSLNTTGLDTYYVESRDVFASVTFPHAGVYVYDVTESDTTNDTIGADPVHETLTYSGASYEMSVYVDNKDDGGTYVAAVGIEQLTTDGGAKGSGKVDGSLGGDQEEYFYSQMTFTNTYVHTNGAPNPDNPNPLTDSTLSIGKLVDGGLANEDQYFDFTLTLTAPSLIPTDDVPTYYKAYVVEKGAVIDPSSNASSTLIQTGQKPNNYSYITVSTSDPTDIQLRHGQSLVFINTPVGTQYTVSEAAASGYQPTYVVTTAGTPASEVDGTTGQSLEVSNQLVGEGVNTTVFTNNRDIVTATGLTMNNLPFVGIIGLIVLALVGYVVFKSRQRAAQHNR